MTIDTNRYDTVLEINFKKGTVRYVENPPRFTTWHCMPKMVPISEMEGPVDSYIHQEVRELRQVYKQSIDADVINYNYNQTTHRYRYHHYGDRIDSDQIELIKDWYNDSEKLQWVAENTNGFYIRKASNPATLSDTFFFFAYLTDVQTTFMKLKYSGV